MKVKADKKAKQANPKLHKIKQSKNDIVKSKEKKTGPAASVAATAHSFAVKKALAVKKKNSKQNVVDVVQTTVQKVPKKDKPQKSNEPIKKKEKKVIEQQQPAQNKKSSDKPKKKQEQVGL